MDTKMYVWLFNNIDKYEFNGEEARQIKEAISRMIVTEGTIESEAVMTKMYKIYSSFCKLFYNNIFGYQNGLANNQITASELDCYMIQTSNGMVPIGFYRRERPAEAVSKVRSYLEQCKIDIGDEKNRFVADLQSEIDYISLHFDKIKKLKNPGMIKAIIGAVVVTIAYAFSIFSLIKMDALEVLLNWGNANVMSYALSGVPIISNGDQYSWIIFFMFTLTALTLAVFGTIGIIKEFIFIVNVDKTNNILKNVLDYVKNFEHNIANSAERSSVSLLNATQRGENKKIIRNENSALVMNLISKIKKAKAFTAKSEKRRGGISYGLLVPLIIIVVLYPFSYVQAIADMFKNDDNLNGVDDQNIVGKNKKYKQVQDEDIDDPKEEPKEEPKVSSYAAYSSDVTWNEANQYAQNQGGHLVYINDAEEFEKVCQIADEKNIKVFWVGAKKGSSDYWEDVKWSDGEDITYIKWLSGEPTYYDEDGNEENYLMVFKVRGEWYFNDGRNDVSSHYAGKIGYVVEFEE